MAQPDPSFKSRSSIGMSAIWYTLAVLVMRAVSVAMLPVYTRYLSPSDYGILQLLAMVTDVAAILFTAGMSSGVQRFYFKAESEEDRNRVIATALYLEVGLALVATLLLYLSAAPIASRLLDGAHNAVLVRIVAVDFSLNMLSAVPLLYLQTLQRAREFVAATLVRVAIQVGLNLLFLVGFGWGVRSMLLSTLIANAVLGVWLASWLLRHTGTRGSMATVRDLRRFGVPNQIAFAGAFITTFGDRFFIKPVLGLAAVGIYGLAYQFGFLLFQVAGAPFLQAWNPARFKLVGSPPEQRDPVLAKAFFLFNVIVLGAFVGLSVFIGPILTLLTTPAFHEAAQLVPVILFAYVVQCWTDAARFGLDAVEKTAYHAYGMWIAVAATLVFYVILIPSFGLFGAAAATLLGFAVRLGMAYYWSQRFWPVRYGWPRVIRMTAIGIGVIGLFYAVQPDGFWRQIALGAFCTALFATVVWAFVMTPPERTLIATAVRSPRRALGLLAADAGTGTV